MMRYIIYFIFVILISQACRKKEEEPKIENKTGILVISVRAYSENGPDMDSAAIHFAWSADSLNSNLFFDSAFAKPAKIPHIIEFPGGRDSVQVFMRGRTYYNGQNLEGIANEWITDMEARPVMIVVE